MAKNPKFEALLQEILELHNKKNEDYATGADPFSNFRGCEKFGVPAWKGVLVRMSDKWSRICNIVNKGTEAQNEPLDDSFRDLAVYSLIALLLYKEQ
jgi:hypothetical protein